MVQNMSQVPAPPEGRGNASPQFDRNPSEPYGDYGDRSPFGSHYGGMMDREGYNRHFIRGERSTSLERGSREMRGEGPYGPPRGFYGGPQPDPCNNPIGYGSERMYGFDGKGRDDYGWPGRSDYGLGFERFSSQGRRDFGGYNHGYGEAFRPPFRPEQWGYGDRHRGGHDRSRRGDYYGMEPSSRSGYSYSPSGYRNGPQRPFQPVHQSRYGYPGRYN